MGGTTGFFFIIGILAVVGESWANDQDSFTRNSQSTNKKPRDVGTVARIDHRRRSRIYDPSFDVNQPDIESTIDGNLFDLSSKNPNLVTHEDEDYFQWSSWSDWSPCSRTCDGGISFRQRTCASRFKVATKNDCEGSEIEHKLCFAEKCPPESQDFLEMQCSLQNGKLFHERNFKWVPFFGKEGNTCELTCMASNQLFYHTFGRVFDGTRCGKQRQGICVQGECVNIGCDGVLRSNATEDACGVCGGSNSTCAKFESVVDRLPGGNITVGYKEIATVPIGATRILVKDYNENFLSLVEVESSSEKYILNGNWVVKWTGQFQAAGSVGTYELNGDEETLNIIGPTTKELKIMVFIMDVQHPLVEYEYWIPPTNATSHIEEFKRTLPKVIRLQTEEDYRKQVIAAGLNFDAIRVPGMAVTTASTTISPIATTSLRTTAATTRSKDRKTLMPRPLPTCRVCQRGGNKKKHFCESNFVFHIRVLPRRPLVRTAYTGYIVEIWHNYKSNVKVSRREYVWVPRSCCPRLRPSKHYLVMGRAARISSNAVSSRAKRKVFKSPFIVSHVNYWYSWTKQNYKMIRMTRRLNCRRFRYNIARYNKRGIYIGR